MVYFFQEPVPNGLGWIPDLTPAAHYGELAFIFGRDERPYSNPVDARERAKVKLKDFNPEKDYICWANAGDIFAIYIVVAVLTCAGHKNVRALQWQKARHERPGRYIPASFPVND